MKRVAVFVDAGYLFAQGSILMFGAKLPRGEISLSYSDVVAAFRSFAEATSGVSLLRIYWYDGTSSGPTSQHTALAFQDSVKVRLGFVNSYGEQKGVDSLIVTDMISLARNRGMSDAVLLSGDEDLRVGVQQAQDFGVRVHLLGIKPSRGSQSVFLIQEADTSHEWVETDLAPFFTRRASRPTPGFELAIPELPVEAVQSTVAEVDAIEAETSSDPVSAESSLALPFEYGMDPNLESITAQPDLQLTTSSQFEIVAREIAVSIPAADLPSLVDEMMSSRTVPPEYDGKLLARSRAEIKRPLDSSEKREVRKRFVDTCVFRAGAVESAKEQ